MKSKMKKNGHEEFDIDASQHANTALPDVLIDYLNELSKAIHIYG